MSEVGKLHSGLALTQGHLPSLELEGHLIHLFKKGKLI